MASVDLSSLIVVKGEDYLSLYQFGTKEAKHYFCSKCGIYTHHLRRSNPNEYGFNVGCLHSLEAELSEIPTYDGVNHPSDRK